MATSFQFPKSLELYTRLEKQELNIIKPQLTSLLLPFALVLSASAPLSPVQFLVASEAVFQIPTAGGVLVLAWNFNYMSTTTTVFCKVTNIYSVNLSSSIN
jgi:hypothetical protein